MTNVTVLDVQKTPEEFIDSLLECEHTVSSSLHGLILSVAYSIPTRWVKLGDRLYGDDCKFWDFYLSLSHDYENLVDKVFNNTIDVEEWNSIYIKDDIPPRDELINKTNIFNIPEGMIDDLLKVCPL
jgi:hypothetical protein